MAQTQQDIQACVIERRRARWTALAGWLACSLVITAVYWAAVRPELRLWRGMATHGGGARVALTFDDGPDPLWAPLLADTLERHGARGTFFLVGREAMMYPELTARLARGGHEIGNHSYTHPYPNLTRLSPAGVRSEVAQADALLTQFTDQPIYWLRPPGGGVNDAVIAAARAHGMRLGWWSYNAADAADAPAAITAARLRQHLRPGTAVLLHQRRQTVEALARFFAAGEGAHYDYTTFTELMEQ
jgi:peptidoglycan/xylan/chitin deacetylase (PgdA/CDA1 family)